jgi:hypothetical protein
LTVMRATRSSTWTSTGSDTHLSLVTVLFIAVLEHRLRRRLLLA